MVTFGPPEIALVPCPLWMGPWNKTSEYCPGVYTVEYHRFTPPLFRIIDCTCGHDNDRFFDPMTIWAHAAQMLYRDRR